MKIHLRKDIDREFPPVEYHFEPGDQIEVTRCTGRAPHETHTFTTTVREALSAGDLSTQRGTVDVSARSTERPEISVGLGAKPNPIVVGRAAGDERWDGDRVVDFSKF